MLTEIPHIRADDESTSPGWASVVNGKGEPLKPVIRCNCGRWVGLRLHHVHADGTVTASFFHSKACDPEGCDWHVFLKLVNYTGGEFPPES